MPYRPMTQVYSDRFRQAGIILTSTPEYASILLDDGHQVRDRWERLCLRRILVELPVHPDVTDREIRIDIQAGGRCRCLFCTTEPPAHRWHRHTSERQLAFEFRFEIRLG